MTREQKAARARSNWQALAWRIRWAMGKPTRKKARTMHRLNYWVRVEQRNCPTLILA